MITWTCKPLAALGIFVMLGACDTTDSSFLASLTPPSDAALPAIPLTQARMMRDQVTLVPPSGYCIDPDSLSQSFALMARCDNLGAPTGGTGAPVGVLTVSFARSSDQNALPTAQELTAATGLASPGNTRRSDSSVIFQTTGPAPSGDLSTTHWRSVTLVGPFLMGAALFGPEGRRAVSDEGARVLQEMIELTTDRTNAS
jgi:hypothetical protein